jgi:acyl-CoA hydrolase
VETFASHDAVRCAQAIVDRVGPDIRLATPIGIGKPVLLLNALYRLAEADQRLKLTIFTGLTLTRPVTRTDLERRFVAPLLDRLFATYPEPAYVEGLRSNSLPPNITIHEFFLQAGAWLTNGATQRGYVSLNYSHVARHLREAGTNVFVQLVAPGPAGSARVSLSSNTDITLDMLTYVAARRAKGEPVVVACELNANLPYMTGEAEVELSQLDVVLEPESPAYALFAPPKEPVALADYAMGLHAATLIKDGGTLQIGIGSFSDALTQALILRHTNNAAFRDLLQKLGTPLHPDAQLGSFDMGLYGCTEMLVDGFLALKRAGILKRRVATSGGGKAVVHAGFFVGNRDFYRQLKDMPPAELAEICMTAISTTNTLEGDAARKRAERVHARFVNTAMTATLLGAVSSDATDDSRVVSGVGGQLDLVSMAHRLEGARSIIALRSTRRRSRQTVSNIAWSYANTTVPRSLRDVIVTEYGIADLRGKSDRDTVVAMLGVTDAAFHLGLQQQAQRAGKLEQSYPAPASDNHPEKITAALGAAQAEGLLPAFPLGSDMDGVEQTLVGPLSDLKTASYGELLRIALRGLSGARGAAEKQALDRLGLARPSGFKEYAMRTLVCGALRLRGIQS